MQKAFWTKMPKNILFAMLVCVCAFGEDAQERFFAFFSNIPPASTEVINVNPQYCDARCLYKLSDEGQIISFVARFDKNIDDKKLHDLMEKYANALNIYYKLRFDPLGRRLEVALLIPKKNIGKYSTTTIDTILAYLAARDVDFRFKIFDSVDEELDSISKVASKINGEHFNFLIAMLTKVESVDALSDIDIPIYIPAMARTSDDVRSNIVFGGIDYNAQIDALIKQTANGVTIIFNDDSALGENLGNIVRDSSSHVLSSETITNKVAANFASNMNRYEMFLAGSNVFLNTPIVKSGLILSQINLTDERPSRILSTQVNYNLTLLSLIRGGDVSNIIIANSIGSTNERLKEYGFLLSSDMKYDWVNYSTALGVDLFLSNMTDNIERYFSESFEKNAIIYDVNLYKINNGAFAKIDY